MRKQNLFVILLTIMVMAVPASASPFDDLRNTFSNIRLSLTGQGFTIESISTTQVISNDADLQSADLIVATVANGGGQSIVGEFSGADLTQKISNLLIQYPLKIEIGGISETLKYPIRNEGSLFKYEHAFSESAYWASDAKCLSGYEFCFLNVAKSTWLGNYYRTVNVRKVAAGSYGRLDNPNIYWTGALTTTINGVPFSKEIGSAEQAGSVEFKSLTGEFVARAQWDGSLITGQAVPNPGLYIATFKDGRWKVSDAKYYDDYRASLPKVDAVIYTWASFGAGYGFQDTEAQGLISLINAHNANVDTLTSQDTIITYTSATGESLSHTTSGGANDGTVLEATNRRISSPRIIFTIKAAKLGVLIPVGKPQIISVEAKTFSSGDNNGVAIATFKNIGTATGTFAATFTDSSGLFSPESNVETTKVQVAPGQTAQIAVFISHGSQASEVTRTAKMRVYDYNKPSNYDEKDFGITMTQPKTCVPGSSRTDGGIVYTCKPDGSGEEITLDCSQGILGFADGKYSCQATGGGGTTKGALGTGGQKEGIDWGSLTGLIVLGIILTGIYYSGLWKLVYQVVAVFSNPYLLLAQPVLILPLIIVILAFVIVALVIYALASNFIGSIGSVYGWW